MSGGESDKKYERIWKSMEHCVNVCILSTFRTAREMLCGWNWNVVHENCVRIIQKHMKELNIKDPHEIDKAVCWYAVKTGKDRDPLWRCLCAFFFAAGMQLDKQRRMDAEQFEKVEASKSDKSDKSDQSNQSQNDLLVEILRELKDSHGEMHQKLDVVRSKLAHDNSVYTSNSTTHDNSVNTFSPVNQTQVSQVNNGTVHHHNYHPVPLHPTESLDEFLKKIVGEIKGIQPVAPKSGISGSNGYNPRGEDPDKGFVRVY